jgi:tight adherence protein C
MVSWPVAVGRLSELTRQPELFLWATLFAVAVWLTAGGLAQIGRRPNLAERLARLDVDARLEEVAQVRLGHTLGFEPAMSNQDHHRRDIFPVAVKRLLRPFLEDLGWLVKQVLQRFAPGLADTGNLQRDLRLAARGRTVRGFFAEKVGAALAFAAIPPALAAVGGPVTPPAVWLAAGVVGFLVPDSDLRRQLASRRSHIQMELPAILDQLAIATSAGLSLEQAFAEVAESSDGVVADELRRVMAELTYGRWDSMQEALDSLDRRNNVSELTTLVAQVRAAHTQGVPIMQVLAAQADTLRQRRKAALVEAGGKASVKMVVPIAVFILPVLAIVILVPAAIQLMQIGG